MCNNLFTRIIKIKDVTNSYPYPVQACEDNMEHYPPGKVESRGMASFSSLCFSLFLVLYLILKTLFSPWTQQRWEQTVPDRQTWPPFSCLERRNLSVLRIHLFISSTLAALYSAALYFVKAVLCSVCMH